MNHSHGLNSKPSKLCPVVLFWLGGQRMGVRAEEVGGLSSWPGAFPTPSETPGMRALLRHGADWVPVLDLAGALRTPGPSEESLCLIVDSAS